MLPAPWRVIENRQETRDVFTLALEPVSGAPFPVFSPGQFNMLYAFGAGESAISISGEPATSHGSLVHTIRIAGPVTAALTRLVRGAQIGLRGPFGTAWPMPDLRGCDLVFVAGGIGLAPLRPAIAQAIRNRLDYGRLVILAGARTPADLVFREDLQAWRGLPDVACEITVDRADETWLHRVGVVTPLIAKAAFDPARAAALVCGPEIMMRYAVAELRRLGVADERIYLSIERNMKCAVAHCGHCQLGPAFICQEGPVFRYDRVAFWFAQREV